MPLRSVAAAAAFLAVSPFLCTAEVNVWCLAARKMTVQQFVAWTSTNTHARECYQDTTLWAQVYTNTYSHQSLSHLMSDGITDPADPLFQSLLSTSAPEGLNVALRTAVDLNEPEVVDVLLSGPVRPNQRGINRAFLRAADRCHLEALDVLLRMAELKPSSTAVHWTTARAAELGCTTLLERLIADPVIRTRIDAAHVLRIASINGQTDVVDLLMAAWEHWNQKDIDDAVVLATERGFDDVVWSLMDGPAPPSLAALEHMLKVAAEWGHPEFFELYDGGYASTRTWIDVLFVAARHGCVACLDYILPTITNTAVLNKALLVAVSNSQLGVMAALLTHSKIDQKGVNEAACIAAAKGQHDAIALLMQHSLQPDDESVGKAYLLARNNRHHDVVDRLSERHRVRSRPIMIHSRSASLASSSSTELQI